MSDKCPQCGEDAYAPSDWCNVIWHTGAKLPGTSVVQDMQQQDMETRRILQEIEVMSDGLVQRLRDLGDHAAFEPHMHHTAADRIEELEAKLAKATELLIHSTEENLWNAYHSGHCDEADAWTHMFMSDGEWLVREIGLDPEQARYDAEEIRDAIPATARKIVLSELTGGKDE